MLDVMASGDDTRTDRYVDHESMAQELSSVLSKVLKDREIIIIRECFGIGCHEKGLEEIGDELGLTRERVRQIREKSIAKLRDSGNAKILMKYLG
jgi:RNA polymerase primary sigma factor